MRLVFSAPHFAYFRNFESVLEALAAEGHDIHIAADEAETFGGHALVERLAALYPRVTYGSVPSAAGEPWMPFAQKVRYALDYARFRSPALRRCAESCECGARSVRPESSAG